MPQSSLMTWLSKPMAVKEPPPSQQRQQHESIPTLPERPSSSQEQNATAAISTELPQEQPFLSANPNLKPLPPNVELRSCTKEDIPNLKRLIGLLLQIPYPDKFFKEIIEDPVTNSITLLAVWQDDPTSKCEDKGRLVGAIRCRLLAHPLSQTDAKRANDAPMLYLGTLALLSPYRSHGIATHLLHTLTKRAIEDYGISSVGAHVWEANAEGLEWYRKRNFKEVARDTGYYRRLKPQTAVVMQRDVSVMDLVGD